MNNYIEAILKYLNNHSSNDHYISFEELNNELKLDETLLENSLKYLVLENFINEKITISEDGGSNLIYCSTIKGKEYFKIKHQKSFFKFIKFLFASVIIPCIVAYITSRFSKPDCKHCEYSDKCGYCYSEQH